MEKQNNVPKLRFPEFLDGWEVKKLGDLLEFKNGINATKEQYGKGYKFINVLDILNNDFITHDKIIGSVDVSEDIFNKYPVNYGDILFQRSSETREEVGTASVYLDKENTATFGGFVIRGKKIGDYEPFFLSKLLQTDLSRNQITSKSGGSTRYNVGQEILMSIEISFPTLPEQQKIATFLSTVDEKLQALKKKKSLLETYKKGLMQKLFSQEIRFKYDGGNDFKDWEMKKLGEVSDVRDGTHDSPRYVENGFPFITSKNLLKDGSIDFNNITFITEIDYNKVNQRSKVNVNDILFGMIGTIGNPVLVKTDGFAIKNVALIKEQKELINVFLIHFLKGDSINQQFFEQNTGGTQKFLSLSIIRNLEVEIPSLTEQTKIANFLTAIDEKINKVDAQIKQTELWKKGLLQQMFV